eukprot:m.348855 g.348855  ORF g.348855 m.348855 type:complete len:517 (-) comp16563_c2_seq12:293-1843(-)
MNSVEGSLPLVDQGFDEPPQGRVGAATPIDQEVDETHPWGVLLQKVTKLLEEAPESRSKQPSKQPIQRISTPCTPPKETTIAEKDKGKLEASAPESETSLESTPADDLHKLFKTAEMVEEMVDMASFFVSMCVSESPKHGAAVFNVIRCSGELMEVMRRSSELRMGTKEYIAVLQKGCPVADCLIAQGTVQQRLLALECKLRLLSWETDGGAMLSLKAELILEELGKVYRDNHHKRNQALRLAAAFWCGVSSRFCDARLLDQLVVTTRDWNLPPSDRVKLLVYKALTLSELDAVHLFASPTSRHGMWTRSPSNFIVKIKTLLATLDAISMRVARDDDVRFLKEEVKAAGEDLLAELCAKESDDTGKVNEFRDVMNAVGNSPTTEWTQSALPSTHGIVVFRTRESDVLPDVVTTALKGFKSRKRDSTDALHFELWLTEIKEAEPYFETTSVPTYRGRVGFSLYRDRYIRLLRDFAATYKHYLPSVPLTRVLRDTPRLCAIMCDTEQPRVWPEAVLKS